VPYLRAIGVGKLDTLMVSHQDKDHEGGAQAVLDAATGRCAPPCHRRTRSDITGAASPLCGWRGMGMGWRPVRDPASARGTTHRCCTLLRLEGVGAAGAHDRRYEAKDEAALLARHDRLATDAAAASR
jgi:competence protein ComEC